MEDLEDLEWNAQTDKKKNSRMDGVFKRRFVFKILFCWSSIFYTSKVFPALFLLVRQQAKKSAKRKKQPTIKQYSLGSIIKLIRN
ncbi:MAG: hypothetical protein B7C24_03070 [Bacteroidetes bacterium 4572_77]|nr:MAG: hypothetical protein B7C24_03070 [Bacteroidetes bacterium 4572_77]